METLLKVHNYLKQPFKQYEIMTRGGTPVTIVIQRSFMLSSGIASLIVLGSTVLARQKHFQDA